MYANILLTTLSHAVKIPRNVNFSIIEDFYKFIEAQFIFANEFYSVEFIDCQWKFGKKDVKSFCFKTIETLFAHWQEF